MADTKGSTLEQAGQKIVETVKSVGHSVAEGAHQAADWAKEKTGIGCSATEGTDKGVSAIRERMDVIASCGKKVGVVDHVQAGVIKLTRNDSPDGLHHFIPETWVERVDSHVHLKKNSMETEQNWKADAASCGCGS